MKPYLVEITTYAVVMAEDEDHAERVATDYKHDVLGDDWSPRIEVEREFTRLELNNADSIRRSNIWQ